ncbi:hypothetical protein D6C91_10536, partial [Aureobasidium pullulans]
DYSFYIGPLIKCPYYATTKYAYIPLDDYSAKAFNRLIRYYRVLDAFIALKVRVARERARFLRYLNATEYDPNSYVSNVRLRKDADKVKRLLLTIAAFYEEEATKSYRTATKANTIATRSTSALEAIAIYFASF